MEKICFQKGEIMKNPLYKGIKLIHNKESIPMIKKVVSDFDPEIIMEIGTAHGGLTLVFHEACPKAVIHTYDPYRKGGGRKLFGKNVHFHTQDAFKSNLYNICKRKEKKFLFCDGFDKKLEMLNYIKDSLERKIASVTASIEVLESQILRDKDVEVTN